MIRYTRSMLGVFIKIHRKASRSRLIFRMVLLICSQSICTRLMIKVREKRNSITKGSSRFPNPNRIIVGKTHRQCRHDLLFFRLVVLFLCHCNGKEIVSDMQVLFFAFCCENWHIRWMNRHPVSCRGGQTFFFMAFR